jgi:hypothetical protein
MQRLSSMCRVGPLVGALSLTFGCGDGASPRDQAATRRDMEPIVKVVLGDSARGTSDGVGQAARFQGITAMCLLSPGQVALSDTFAGTIRLLNLDTAEVTTLAGRPDEPGVVDGTIEESRFTNPRGIGCLPGGVGLLVADDGALRHLDLVAGVVTTVAGRPGVPAYQDGPAVLARLGYLIHAITITPDGRTAIFSDRSNNAVRSVDLQTYEVRTVSGADADWDGPGGLAFDPADPSGTRLFVADTFSNRIREIELVTGSVRNVAAVEAPQGIAIHEGVAFSMGFGPSIARTVLGSGSTSVLTSEFGGTFASPLVVDGELIYAELERGSMRRLVIEPLEDSIIAGSEQPRGRVDGPAHDSRFEHITDMVAPRDGAWVLIADAGNRTLRRARFATGSEGMVDTVAVAGVATPVGLALSVDGARLAIADYDAGLVLEVDVDASGELSAPRIRARGLKAPTGVAWDNDGGLFVAEFDGKRVAKILPDGGIVSLASIGAPFGLVASAGGILVLEPEPAGSIYWSDFTNGSTVKLGGGVHVHAPVDGPLDSATWGYPSRGYAIGPRTWLLTDTVPGTLRLLAGGESGFSVRTVVGSSLRGGGLPAGASVPISRAALGGASAVAVIDGAWLVATDTAVLRVEGDVLEPR